MKTRKEYLNGTVTHDEYWSQFVTDDVMSDVKRAIGYERIVNSKCPHLNDIPLSCWDGIYGVLTTSVVAKLKEAGDVNAATLANKVSLSKQAARILREKHRSKVSDNL